MAMLQTNPGCAMCVIPCRSKAGEQLGLYGGQCIYSCAHQNENACSELTGLSSMRPFIEKAALHDRDSLIRLLELADAEYAAGHYTHQLYLHPNAAALPDLPLALASPIDPFPPWLSLAEMPVGPCEGVKLQLRLLHPRNSRVRMRRVCSGETPDCDGLPSTASPLLAGARRHTCEGASTCCADCCRGGHAIFPLEYPAR
jgi:hypothetical protein